MQQAERDKYWQEKWDEEGVFTWRNDDSRLKYYVLEMFPYTSGRMHIGHARNYSMGDALARMQRARGFDVLYPMGWDAFGLPAEIAAIKHGEDPALFTSSSIASMKYSMRSMGLSYSWPNEISTCEPDHIAAQQRLFIEFFKAGLIYRDNSFLYWCKCSNSVLAAEQAAGGVCWRCGEPVTKRREAQWFINIRSYADRLVDALDTLEEWPESVKNIQRAWIGRSEGIEIDFSVEDSNLPITVFTTRADTLAGCSYLALAPEHSLLETLPIDEMRRREVFDYRDSVLLQTAAERATAPKSGLDTGVRAFNPLTKEHVPVYVANYVLSEYGTGVVMGVPAHDERDFAFAKVEGLAIRQVVSPSDSDVDAPLSEAYTGDGRIINSGQLNGLSPAEASDRLVDILGTQGACRRAKSYRLQNWSISRQRFWGNPLPIVHCQKCGVVPAREQDLPILLPSEVPADGKGSPLSRLPEFYETTCPSCGGAASRETDTMDTFVDSSWYFMRFPTPNSDSIVDPEIVNRLLPVDVYIGGVEHATLHLIYSRFVTKVMKDLGLISFDEPFIRLYNHGMVNDQLGRKQSKSVGNVVEPLEVLEEFGADALRMYLLFKTAYNAPIDWESDGVRSASKFLNRVRRLVKQNADALQLYGDCMVAAKVDCGTEKQLALCRITHETIEKVTRDTESFQFNTAIAAIMELTNAIYQFQDKDRVLAGAIRTLIRLLNPYAPHVTEDMWRDTGGKKLLASISWPEFDSEAAAKNVFKFAIQVNGKFVSEGVYSNSMSQSEIVSAVLQRTDVRRRIANRLVMKKLYVPQRVVNIIVDN